MKITFIASLTQEINTATPGVIQLFPAGEFRARDGRPIECDAWLMTREIAERLITAADARKTPYVLDYEHQTLRSAKNGKPAPAAAFFKQLEWREGEGLFAIDVEWTPSAAAMVTDKAYRFISPVFLYDKSGHVLEILHAALTNTPAVDGMEDVLLAAASLMAAHLTTEGTTAMEELLERLRWMLNLPITATAEDIITELNKLITQISGADSLAAATYDLAALIAERQQAIADLTAKVDAPDPAKWVAVDIMHQSVQQAREAASNDVAALTAQQNEVLITAALSDGRLLPAQESWARSLSASDQNSLKSYLESAPKIAALTATQTQGKVPSGVRAPLSDVQTEDEDGALAVCSLMGVDPEDVKKYGGV